MQILTRIKRYIEEGTDYGLKKMVVLTILLILFFWGSISMLANRIPDLLSQDSFLKDLPTIELKEGVLVQPVQTIWQKEIHWDKPLLIQLDTRIDDMAFQPSQDGIYITRKSVYIKEGSSVQTIDLPDESWTMTPALFKKTARTMTLFLGWSVAFSSIIFFWIGFGLTIGITCFILFLMKKRCFPGTPARATVFSWTTLYLINMLCFLWGKGYPLVPTAFLSSLISLFLIIKSTED